ncbi:calcineurin-like phosphoesterase [Aspergillus parasiticus]|uniref:Calcineurin-like phosphoesterase n=1 Tax=Aspergillus parasiticus TaxID=5067 RepID=A0A5N6E427_ASPPA|nr:calcineurin-like phosphoesterase [Aspergillus parasiticus]
METQDIPQSPSTPFQILSDLHLEINQQYPSFEIPVCAKYLILAGDIGRLTDYDHYLHFIQQQTSRFELVFLTLGNHEFYNVTFSEGLEKARQLERESSLQGRRISLESRAIVQAKIKDFQKIKDWTIDDHNKCHEADLDWLMNEIRGAKKEPETKSRSVLVVTHHAPLRRGTSSPRHAENAWGEAFGSEVLSGLDGVGTWVFGHTHYTTDFREGGTRVVSNQRGYVLPWSERDGEGGFDVGKVVYV